MRGSYETRFIPADLHLMLRQTDRTDVELMLQQLILDFNYRLPLGVTQLTAWSKDIGTEHN